ncbi:MAG: PQQ-binding-like beta-propeller repeat protein [Gemmatimonadales bacterium]
MNAPAGQLNGATLGTARRRRSVMFGRLGETGMVLSLAFGLGCSQLVFLKGAAVPTKPGASSTVHGPAYSPATSIAANLQPNAQEDWITYNRTLSGDRYALGAQITPANVGTLHRVCTAPLGERATLQSGPLEISGTLYLTTARTTFALDAESCALRWKHSYAYHPAPDFDLKVNRGVGYSDGRLFRGANDGRLYALDAATGDELWNVVAGDVERGETFPAAPIVWGGLVYIGNAGGDNFGVVGRMMAFDVASGGLVWSVPLVASAGEAARTWPASTEVLPRTGGATWTSYALDTLSHTLFIPTGNAGPDFLGAAREGDNLYTTSIVELDSRTGEFRAAHQLVKRDVHDWDASAAPALVTTATGRPLIIAGGKDGHVYGIDRRSGEQRYRTAVTRIENVDAPLTAEGTRFCPGVNGGVEWNGPAFSPVKNAVFVNSIEWCTTVKVGPVADLKGKTALPWTGSRELRHPFGVNDSVSRGALTALDADDGHILWQFQAPTPLVAGVTPTAGGLVFTGDLEGTFYAFDAASGAVLFQDKTGAPIGGGVISYSRQRRQYVAVAVGMHAPGTWGLESPDARVIVYALPK